MIEDTDGGRLYTSEGDALGRMDREELSFLALHFAMNLKLLEKVLITTIYTYTYIKQLKDIIYRNDEKHDIEKDTIYFNFIKKYVYHFLTAFKTKIEN